jgi:Ca2+-binding EF-hand superfamily protein
MKNRVIDKFGIQKEDIQDFLDLSNFFKDGEMNFDSFKKNFFPHLYLIQEDNYSDDDRKERQQKKELKDNKDNQNGMIIGRLRNLERVLKSKFANNWDSVRKAFLDLDTDYDGFITVEDILRYFGQDSKKISFHDLKKLFMDKDSKGVGKIGYSDFSKWVGNSIHQSEGFYFRHDSIRNP